MSAGNTCSCCTTLTCALGDDAKDIEPLEHLENKEFVIRFNIFLIKLLIVVVPNFRPSK